MNVKDLAEKKWEEHCNSGCTCKNFGKFNNRGGTTENYHAFIVGFTSGYKEAHKK